MKQFQKGFSFVRVLSIATLIVVIAVAAILAWEYLYVHQRRERPPVDTATLEEQGILDAPAAQTPPTNPLSEKTSDYMGAWFTITFPAEFTVRPVGRVVTDGKTDEAAFVSPDGSAEFYVYSPLWGGNPSSYLEALPTEKKISDESTSTVTSFTNTYGTISTKKVTRWVTFEARNKLYKRSFVSIKNDVFDKPNQYGQDATFHFVFGFKYKDQATYTAYLPAYLAFKKSLIQYSD